MSALSSSDLIGVVGAGAMGAGIAQVAAAAGHPVLIHDTRPLAADKAIETIRANLAKQVEKGRMTAAAYEAAASSMKAVTDLSSFKASALVIEAVVEDLDVKKRLFSDLESIVANDAILATNTSSISVTAIGSALKHAGRLVGMHFFNPAPVMQLVEVVSGVATEMAIAERIYDTARAWGKKPVHTRSTPGFIVNRVARPFYAEGLRLLQEGVADCATIDALMREAGGFRMGPFELMDMIGHDVNYAVTRSVFDGYYGDPRFSPSLLQLERVQAGFLGRKSGRGFYDYGANAVPPRARTEAPVALSIAPAIWSGTVLGAALAGRLHARGLTSIERRGAEDGVVAAIGETTIYLSDGRTATARAAATGNPNVVVVDLVFDPATATRIAAAPAEQCSDAAWRDAVGLLQASGLSVSRLRDSPGLAVMRTVAMLANEACDAVHQQVCSPADVDLAMRAGVAYPAGPLEWADRLGASTVLAILDNLAKHYGEPRYRASPRLRQSSQSGKGLHEPA
ncbi:3-hydroxyacyl-CoA dehydrogenase [Solimonas soli]|uniref:3-hydroxyacyl-CoA dehydrogenase n=1 Tax=Solimonas soli TaxID=413479 RepID=UPI00048485A0|nr:3-hydroxyacyl-CoA dehydrogenase [Solimonas soli]